MDFLDFRESKCMEKSCQQTEFHFGSRNCRCYHKKNIKNYFKNKLKDLKLQTIDYKLHFKKPCFNCSFSFHGSNYDSYSNIQKMPEIRNECVVCQRNFTTERAFYHNCNICNATLKNCKLLVHHHRKKHNSKKPYQCVACYLSLSCETALNRHFLCKHKLPHKCPYCSKRHATKSHLQKHELSHNGEYQFSCKYCPKQYTKKHSLDIHLFEHTGGKKFKCDFCAKTFATQWLLNQHKSFHKKRSFQCEYCPNQYKTKQTLDIHLFEHIGGKEFKCDICDKKFAVRFMLNQHKLTHGEKPLQCNYCHKKYKRKQGLDIHLFEHTGGKEFKCDICDKTFAKRFKLNKHKLTHTERVFQCKLCPKKYKAQQHLDIHLFEHTGGKQFKCDLCDKTFARKYDLNRHKSIHVKRSFPCKYCSQKYKTKQNLDLHLLEHTGGKKI